ncbi:MULTISPECIES: hypothetical protein [Paraburkholderia]|nr:MULTISPECIES: hypothetical protein [Paraburkholderia]MDH6152315.1 hypothetical protein [Paraburkholderia sp. WSM4179]
MSQVLRMGRPLGFASTMNTAASTAAPKQNRRDRTIDVAVHQRE